MRFGGTKQCRDQPPQRGKGLNLPEGSGLRTGVAQGFYPPIRSYPTRETKMNIMTQLAFREQPQTGAQLLLGAGFMRACPDRSVAAS